MGEAWGSRTRRDAGEGGKRLRQGVEAATLHWVDWFNHHRLLEANGDLPPVELEQAHYRQHTDIDKAG